MSPVYVASMNLRGTWAAPLDPLSKKINVTSAQPKSSKNRLAFSPMTPIEGGYKGFWNFESYWQSGKVFRGVPAQKSKTWWLRLKQPRRRYPNSKKMEVLYAQWETGGDRFNKVEARKQVYVPQYMALVKGQPVLAHYQQQLKEGCSLTIYDFDGPRSEDGSPQCRLLTEELLRQKIGDERFPFGHGYVVAAAIAGIAESAFV